MKAENLFCCATLAFVNRRSSCRTSCGITNGSNHLPQNLHLSCDHTNANDCHGYGKNNGGSFVKDRSHHNSRRSFLDSVMSGAALFLPFSSAVLLLMPQSARGACLSGDIRPDCIGVYKLPFDSAESPYVATPEKLKVYAPDLLWVPPVEYPSSYGDALVQLRGQRQLLDEARDFVARGEIENAGLAFLEMIPKVGAAGTVIMRNFVMASNKERNAAMKKMMNDDATSTTTTIRSSNSSSNNNNDGNPSSTPEATALEMKAYRIEYSLDELRGYMGETDVLIGQGLRGQLGVSAPAQIEILSSISDCRKEFDNLLLAVPEKLLD